MNIALEQTEEYVNGQVSCRRQCVYSIIVHLLLQLKNKYGDAFIRGNNGMFT